MGRMLGPKKRVACWLGKAVTPWKMSLCPKAGTGDSKDIASLGCVPACWANAPGQEGGKGESEPKHPGGAWGPLCAGADTHHSQNTGTGGVRGDRATPGGSTDHRKPQQVSGSHPTKRDPHHGVLRADTKPQPPPGKLTVGADAPRSSLGPLQGCVPGKKHERAHQLCLRVVNFTECSRAPA